MNSVVFLTAENPAQVRPTFNVMKECLPPEQQTIYEKKNI